MNLTTTNDALIGGRPPEVLDGFRLTGWDPINQIAEYMKIVPNGTSWEIKKRDVSFNVDKHLSANVAEANDHINARWKDGRKVASIPTAAWHGLGLEDAMLNKDQKKLSRILNDSDYRKFRTFEGKL